MLTELFRLVIRGERNEGRTVEVAAHHLPCVIPQHFAHKHSKGVLNFSGAKETARPPPVPQRGAHRSSSPGQGGELVLPQHVSVISVGGGEDGAWVVRRNNHNTHRSIPVRRSNSAVSAKVRTGPRSSWFGNWSMTVIGLRECVAVNYCKCYPWKLNIQSLIIIWFLGIYKRTQKILM